MLQGSLATTAIITKGLTGGHNLQQPCKHGLITSVFSLYCVGLDVGGGGYPGDAWNKLNPGELNDFYKVLDNTPYIIPRDQEEKRFKRHKMVTITVKMGNMTSEKEYVVPLNKANIIIKAFDLLEATRKQIGIAVTKITKVMHKIKLTISKVNVKFK